MKIIIIGGGVVGVTTAYLMATKGHEVLVVERQGDVGLGASYANGALLTPSMSEPWNAPGAWRALVASIGDPDAAMRLRLHALPHLMRWGIQFLRNSQVQRFEHHTRLNLSLALHSRKIMEQIQAHTQIKYGRSDRGSLRIFRKQSDLDLARSSSAYLSRQGVDFRCLSVREVCDLEPALNPIASQLKGAIHYPQDASGDAFQFCRELTHHARRYGAEFVFGEQVKALEVRRDDIAAIRTDVTRYTADRYVVAAGVDSAALLYGLGIRLPIQPVKGYSITLPDAAASPSLTIPVVDNDLHAAIVPLKGFVRVAGTAEFTGFDSSLDPHRIANLQRLLNRVLPCAEFELDKVRAWCGLRPTSADGMPIIGPTPYPSLFVNSGHGHLGWTLAAGSADLLEGLISRHATALDTQPFELSRFQ